MRAKLKDLALYVAKYAGLFRVSRRLTGILCYHGIGFRQAQHRRTPRAESSATSSATRAASRLSGLLELKRRLRGG